ncbi:MAG: metallophosphoesterase [Phycisphaerales bacterium]|nr:metallophosphoesterase [Phycisphaerales bacterium]
MPLARFIAALALCCIPLLAIAEPPRIIWPSQGRPLFTTRDTEITIIAELPEGAAATAALERGGPAAQRVELSAVQDAAGADASRLRFTVPADTPQQTWDLVLSVGGRTARARSAVAVRDDLSRIRVVHVSDLNLGAIGAPQIDPRLLDEINLLGPTLVLLTGDLVDITHDDPAAGWDELSAALARLDAPIVAACGEHDDLAQFGRCLAPGPVGSVEVGPHRVLVLYDVPQRPIALDVEQCEWAGAALARSRGRGLTMVLSHSRSAGFLQTLVDADRHRDLLANGRVGLWFLGGSDPGEHPLAEAVAPTCLVQTPPASALGRSGAGSEPRFRVLDIAGTRVSGVREEGGRVVAGDAWPVGRLSVRSDSPPDGSASVVRLLATNNHPFRVEGLRRRIALRADGDSAPWVRGATLLQSARSGNVWQVDLGWSLPDKGAARIVVGTGAAPPDSEPVVRFDIPARITLEALSDGGYCVPAATGGTVWLRNAQEREVRITPLLMLDAATVAYSVAGVEGGPATAYQLTLAAGQQIALKPAWATGRVRPGGRELQVYLRGGEWWSPICTPLQLDSPLQDAVTPATARAD